MGILFLLFLFVRSVSVSLTLFLNLSLAGTNEERTEQMELMLTVVKSS